MLPNMDPDHQISILPPCAAGGYTFAAERERYLFQERECGHIISFWEVEGPSSWLWTTTPRALETIRARDHLEREDGDQVRDERIAGPDR
jgi:hypothetical protein